MKNIKVYSSIILMCFALILGVFKGYSQQDPQYTQYMYNTMSVNPAYVGSKGHGVVVGIGRTQWVGFDGAPDTQTLSYDTPVGYRGLGMGVSLVSDRIGTSTEMYLDGNVSYAIETGELGKLALGLKLGGRLFNVNFNEKNRIDKNDVTMNKDIVNRFMPTVGAGVYYYEPKWYVGFAIPNFLSSEHYKKSKSDLHDAVAVERMHFFLIGGYVFDLNESVKFKPAALLKAVPGAPIILDASANFLFNEKFRAGVSWRWNDAISAMLGYQLSKSFQLGYSYDLTSGPYRLTNNGTHEIMFRYDLMGVMRMKSPRFF